MGLARISLTHYDFLLTMIASAKRYISPKNLMPSIETDPESSPGRRPKKNNGIAQALTMILAWVGGAGAAVAAAFWILKIVKPAQEPEIVETYPPSVVDVDDQPKFVQNVDSKKQQAQKANRPSEVVQVKPKAAKPKAAKPKAVKRPVVDRRNFQPPDMLGLTYCSFEGNSLKMSDFETAVVSRTGVLVDVDDLSIVNQAKGLRLAGFWETKTDQPYDFFLTSADVARVWIDGQVVLNKTTQSRNERVKASQTIAAGVHPVRIDLISSAGFDNFKLDVAGAGDKNRISLPGLLQPFQSAPSSLERLLYDLAKFPAPVASVVPLIESNQNSFAFESTEADRIGF